MNFCPNCRVKLIKDNNSTKDEEKTQPNPVLSLTKNKAIWKVEKGEIARRIDESEFATLSQISGLIVHLGTTAVVCVDGKKVCLLNGGVYDFVTQEEINKVMNERIADNSSLYGINTKLWNGLIRLIRGKKVEDNINKSSKNDLRTMDQVIQSLNANSVISIYLKLDNSFPLLYGTKVEDEGNFMPLTIKTRHLDVEFGLSMMVQISDFEVFIKHYLGNKSSVTTADIQKELESYVHHIMQDELKYEEIDEYGISPMAKDRISLRIKALDSVLYGIQIVNVIDITCSNKDFERFRHLAKELYCSEKELDFLKRTNEFKNRLVCVENEQKLWNAKNDLEVKKALDEINRDGKLHEEEEHRFYTLITRQRKIKNAQDEMEDIKALNDIEQTKLLNQDEFDAFKDGLEAKKIDRNNIHEVMRLQSLAEATKKATKIAAEVTKCEIEEEAGIEVVRFDAYKQGTSQAIEKMDIMEVIYGKKYESRKRRLLEEQEITSLGNRFKNAQELEAAANRNKLLFQELEGARMKDDYEISKVKNIHDANRTMAKDLANDALEIKSKENDIEISLQDKQIDLLAKKQAMALNAMAMLKEMEAKEKEQAHLQQKDIINLHINKEIHVANLEHEEKMKELDIKKDLTAEQMFVDKLDSNSRAAEIFAGQYSSAKELEAERRAQAKIDQVQQEALNSKNEVVEILKSQLDRTDNDKKSTVETITNLVKDLTGNMMMNQQAMMANQQAREDTNFQRFERVATHRMGEFGENANQRLNDERALKEEYKEQMKYEQKRHDFHQDKALQYTTQVTEAEYKSSKPRRDVEIVKEVAPVFYLDNMGNIPFQLEQLKGLVLNGNIHKKSIIRTPEAKFYAGDLSALRESFQQCDFVVCPNSGCGNKIKKEDAEKGFCPYCGNEI